MLYTYEKCCIFVMLINPSKVSSPLEELVPKHREAGEASERTGIFYSSIEEEMYQNEATQAEQADAIKAEKQQAVDAIENTKDKEPVILSEEEITELLNPKSEKNELLNKKHRFIEQNETKKAEFRITKPSA